MMSKYNLVLEEKALLAINEIMSEISLKYDQLWIKRKRLIDSKFLMSFIFHVISNKNNGYGISLLDLWENYETKNIEAPQQEIFAPSSVCEARQKLSEQIFKPKIPKGVLTTDNLVPME